VSTLHITNGDCAAATLRTFLAGPVVITADALYEGPVPDVDGDAWYDARARYLCDGEYAGFDEAKGSLAAWDRAIVTHDRGILLWFEHDLFDQLLLIRTLDLIGRSGRPAATSLICLDRFPGVEPFIGLGQLSAAQLAPLVDTQQPVSPDQFALASRAWKAFRASDPRALLALAGAESATAGLPFLSDALRRFLGEYPSTANGLSRSGTSVLDALAQGPLDGASLFAATQARERQPFMGDWTLFRIVKGLADARVPLVSIVPDDRPLDLRPHTIAMTDAGRQVQQGARDAIALNGIDEWRGGVHLAGTARSPWRWDAGRETLVSY
jgi:hypothetical protein